MSIKSSQTTICSQKHNNHSSFAIKNNGYLQVYKIKVDDMKNNTNLKKSQRNIYLSIKFDDQNETVIQTQCIDIINNNKFFEVKTKADVAKVEVLDYDQMKKLSKISLKGIDKEFKYTHVEEKKQISILIQRTHVCLEFFERKCKLTDSIIIDNNCNYEKERDSTDDSSSEVSV